MKVYIVVDKGADNLIRLATLRKDIADAILESFPYENLVVREQELIGIEK